MLCQMEESGDSIGCTSLFFKNEGWIVHEWLQTEQGAPGNQVKVGRSSSGATREVAVTVNGRNLCGIAADVGRDGLLS